MEAAINFYKHHIGDYAQATAHLSFVEDAAYSRLLRKYYAEEKPLPADKKAVQRLVGARTREEREAVDVVLDEFFTLAEDGWRNKRADLELAENADSNRDREARAANERERQRRHREERQRLFEQLRERDIVPAWDTKTEALRAMLVTPPVTRDATATATGASRPVTPPVTRDATANQTPDTRHQTPDKRTGGGDLSEAVVLATTDPPALGGNAQPPTPASRACLACRGANVHDVNPAHPDLLRLLAAGVTPEEIGATAAECAARGKARFAYVLATVERRHREAAEAPPIPQAKADPMAWRKTSEGVLRMGEELGVRLGQHELLHEYEPRVIAAFHRRSAAHPQPEHRA